MTRKSWRWASLVFLLMVALLFIHLGGQGWRINGLPAQYLGYLFVAASALGALGVNVWIGGPLDPNQD